MSYIVTRLFTPPAGMKPEQADEIFQRNILPNLLQVPGLRRVTTLALNDGRIGATILYDDQKAADHGIAVANERIRATAALSGAKLVETVTGQVGLVMHGKGDPNRRNLYTSARFYQMGGSMADLIGAIRQASDLLSETTPGLVRYIVFQTSDNRYAAYSAFEDQASSERFLQAVRAARQVAGSALQHLLPTDPVVYEGIAIGSYTP